MNLVRQGPKKGILYQQVQKHHGAVYSLDFTSKSNDLTLVWANGTLTEDVVNATNLLTVFGPPFFGNVSRHAYLKFMLLTFYSDPTTTDTIFKSICISNTFCSFAGSGWPWLDLWFHGFPWLWGEPLGMGPPNFHGGRCSAGLQLEPPLMFNHFYLHLNWGKLNQASQHTGGERLEYTSLTA